MNRVKKTIASGIAAELVLALAGAVALRRQRNGERHRRRARKRLP